MESTCHYLPKEVAILLHNALVMPLFDYCDIVYGSCGETQLSKLQRLQNFAGKVILKVPYDTPSEHVRSQLNWLSVKKRIYFHESVMMFKCLNGLSPDYLCRKFNHVNHAYTTRQITKHNIQIQKCKLSCGQRTFEYRGSSIWNKIPSDIRNSQSLNVFKTTILKHIYKDENINC